MNLTQLIDFLTHAKDDFGDLPVHMTWTPQAEPGPVVAFKIFGDHVELRCEREAG